MAPAAGSDLNAQRGAPGSGQEVSFRPGDDPARTTVEVGPRALTGPGGDAAGAGPARALGVIRARADLVLHAEAPVAQF